jgi:hypothetical protein
VSVVKQAVALLLGVAIPGLGHAVYGRWFKAGLFAVCIVGLMLLGLYLGHNGNFTPEASQRHPLMFTLQYLVGAPAVAAVQLQPIGGAPPEAVVVPQRFESAILLVGVAGLLNVIVILHLLIDPRPMRDPDDDEPPAGGAGTDEAERSDKAEAHAEPRTGDDTGEQPQP